MYIKGAHMPLIKVILGTTRQSRFGVQPANWIMELSKEHPEATFELVDLADINLPLFEADTPPSMVEGGNYEKEQDREWAKIIGEADGFVFVTAEYNYSIPASLKNAIDHVGNEWNYKPVTFVSYGTVAGGARAVAHLRDIAGWTRWYDLREHVLISNLWGHLDEGGKFLPNEHHTATAHEMLSAVAFWAEKMKPIREELQK
jgi:NAD(P)H-dependent FMN reductase